MSGLRLILLAIAVFGLALFLGYSRNSETTGPEAHTVTVTQESQDESTSSGSEPAEVSADSDSKAHKSLAPESAPSFDAEPVDLIPDPGLAKETVEKADSARQAGNHSSAAQAYNDALVSDPQNPEIPYKSALNYAAWGKSELVYECLGLAADLGYSDVATVKSQNEFDSFRASPRFSKIVSRMESNQ
jgi:hypothetical protein